MKAEEYKYQSGISGRAQIRFGGKIKFALVSAKHMPVHGIALSEWFEQREPGEEMPDSALAHDDQVMILFDNIKSIDMFRQVLDDLEARFKHDAEQAEKQKQLEP